MKVVRYASTGLVAVLVLTAACSRSETPLTPEAARARGDELLKRMSRKLASTEAFSYSTDEVRDRVSRDGSKVEEHFQRDVIVRRPAAMTFVETGGGHDAAVWYNGTHLTIVSNKQKAWARGPMPANLDDAMDFVSAEYSIQLPTADLLYSSPFEALVTAETTGGWVDVQQIDGVACDHLAYQDSLVDWELWLTRDERTLPKQIHLTYKTAPGHPKVRVVFSKWNESPTVSDATFAARIPEGYDRLRIMRHATVGDPDVDPDTPADAPPPSAPAVAPR